MDLPPDSRTALRDWLTEQLADLLGEPLADVRALADDDDLLGCGLDSIRLMYLQERLRARGSTLDLSLIHISEPTRQAEISYAVFCLKKKKKKKKKKEKKAQKNIKKKKLNNRKNT